MPKKSNSVMVFLISTLLVSTTSLADGPPAGGDADAWCEANQNACVTWCETHPDEEICQEPECD
ncbi:MAG: hypothetical protein HOG18_00965 [Proteobacteria bacterium]|jgi:hypothetical protein|nr:hypothetical protein [Pseudomonadota bacterium]MDB4825314.1 hypothetical protein [Gammaproteobacteria bacterium]MBT4107078.1 hypothetical protein [Pseudomonadota bacterium]MBT4357178.1 hypothetical protein [Pseudomonadota bacterium]MBT4987740.1 hypothetical protein [Pseudomonadota bacterium]